ncbi:auxin-responsive protein SAUR68-like [Tripterygium wilfordii]|uniref:auxin-responsive protein SAUR68-like n=1 Tax=Tripterygium wilfordii TaxID=458696 RepID=UPI0018F81D83|nr:auxin-responsive protein SAUR68-like [Tripterygium wilfordii]
MMSTKKLTNLARKWQKLAAIRRKRIPFPGTNGVIDAEACSTTPKGHFVVYTDDERRFVLPLKFLNHEVFQELLKLAEEDFGLPSDGPLTLPCDANFMEYFIVLMQGGVTKDVQKGFLKSIADSRCSSSSYLHQEVLNQQQMICSL